MARTTSNGLDVVLLRPRAAVGTDAFLSPQERLENVEAVSARSKTRQLASLFSPLSFV
jgi:hypothetical protein